MKRGEIWTLAGGGDFAGKPRPALIVQNDEFEDLNSATVCMFTTNPTVSDIRVAVEPSSTNGLDVTSHIMVDKISSVWRHRLRGPIGSLSDGDMERLNRTLMVFLGLAGTPSDR